MSRRTTHREGASRSRPLFSRRIRGRIDLKFGAALPNTVSVIVYGEFENVIEIDRSRNVINDFGI